MHAVLEDAIRCLHGGGSPMRERLSLASEARSWIESGDGRWPYSFENICSALDIDPGRVRSRLARVTPVFAAREPELATRAKHASVAESEVARMIREGHPLRVIAETLGVSISKVSVLSRGLASRLKAERDEEIMRLRHAGWTHRAIADRFNLSRIRVIRICARREPAAA
jgi:DNA-binding NarL/FixJ family response regulator